MGNDNLMINGFAVKCYNANTLVIGSGAASLNAAVSLHSMGQENIIIATCGWGEGTSNNAGSDKQTYYKLSLSGGIPDSVYDMAADLFNGKCMHGDIALCEAQGSVLAFMKLISLGVSFPHDKYGSWAGYKTDHDPRSRATSVGPYTSKRMFEALSDDVKRRGITILDHHHCISLLTDRSGKRVTGALAINTSEQDYTRAFVLFNAVNIVLGTGGPAGIYEKSVYPVSQHGSTGMALQIGAKAQNLTESQFGLASLKFRWNLSGSYQQAIPRYFSTDRSREDEREFLNDFFPDAETLAKAIFLKGYQWPFDPRKIAGYGSSLIDLLVEREINERGRNVYLDFRKNLTWSDGRSFNPGNLDPEVNDYLLRSGALQNVPYERLVSINPQAAELYREQGIDLSAEPLQIAVCAQHNNGGLTGNIWWESNIEHLFPVGEVNGSHGVYRPGGSALNAGQVGSYRAALYISRRYGNPPPSTEGFLAEISSRLTDILNLARKWMTGTGQGQVYKLFEGIRHRMSSAAGIMRRPEKITAAAEDAARMVNELPRSISAGSVSELSDCFRLIDHCITHYVFLEAIKLYIEGGGRSRGSYIVAGAVEDSVVFEGNESKLPELCSYDREIEKCIMEINYSDGELFSCLVQPREIPVQNLWFEKVWKDYLQDNWLDC